MPYGGNTYHALGAMLIRLDSQEIQVKIRSVPAFPLSQLLDLTETIEPPALAPTKLIFVNFRTDDDPEMPASSHCPTLNAIWLNISLGHM